MKSILTFAVLVTVLGLTPLAWADEPDDGDNDAAPANASNQAPAPEDDATNNPNAENQEVHVHHHYHHYHHAPGDPAYYYSQPNGPANPSNQPYPRPMMGNSMGGGGWGGGGWGGGWGGGGGTVAGNAMQGAGAYMQGAGQYNLMTAEAARQSEAARAEWLQNQMSSINDYFLARQANRDYRHEEAQPPLTPQQVYQVEASRVPARLRNDQFNSVTGAIRWPEILRQKELASEIAQLDKLFAARTPDDSGLGSENYHAIQMAINKVLAKLHDEIKNLSPAEYLAGIKFIDSLAYEARFQPSPALVPVPPGSPYGPPSTYAPSNGAPPAQAAPPLNRAPVDAPPLRPAPPVPPRSR